jgi:hypothetical protein
MDTNDLPPEQPVSTVFTLPDCGCVIYCTRCPRYTDNGVYVHVTVLESSILQRCETHQFLREELHHNDSNKEARHYEEMVRFYE